MKYRRHTDFGAAAGLLAHFPGTHLFEYCFRNGSLTFSDNLPPELGLPVRLDGSTCSAQLRELLPEEDWSKLRALVKMPPAPGEEAHFEFRLHHGKGVFLWYECRAVCTYTARQRPDILLGRFEDIHARKEREAGLIARSTRDDLTGLLNRSSVALQAEAWMHSEAGKLGGALFMLDLDNFKSINDSRGHASGDQALRLTARLLREIFRSTDLLGRAGGDEFLAFMTGIDAPAPAAARADTICRVLAERSGASDCGCTFTCSVGVALYPQDGATYSELFNAADAAMYLAKREGKSSYRLCSPIPLGGGTD